MTAVTGSLPALALAAAGLTGLLGAPAFSAEREGGMLLGGRCAYTSHAGTCRIVSIDETAETRAQAEQAGYAGRRVVFAFVPSGEPPADQLGRDAIARQHELRLVNSWFPGPRFLEKYGIRPGAELACRLEVITKGTCTPIVFEFEGIDRADYFENRR